ncbi:M15 family metallopeptidase [Candidatus Dependentiae bacterium]|nr:M15 family metallopeptidase [Candidatus Dependentiae bacterium]
MKNKLIIFALLTFFVSIHANEQLLENLQKLQQAYPDHIHEVNEDYVIWSDGSYMKVEDGNITKSGMEKLNNPSLADQVNQARYISGIIDAPQSDPGRIRYEPFFRKMYGNSPEEVENNLEKIDWMPRIFGVGTYRLKVTKINNVHEKLILISEELEDLVLQHPEFLPFLINPGGTYNWRMIANTNRLSNHSFGMTIDINSNLAQYWQWDLVKEGLKISEESELKYHNKVPWEIVLIFEKYGFIWGGKWYHYDTMHFEYRPELFE